MEGIFTEFENENTLRRYPFAAGCVEPDEAEQIPRDVLIDAALYPVNPVGTVYLSEVAADGTLSISDDTGVVMTGVATGSTVDLFDTTGLRRHVGTLLASSADALAEWLGRGGTRIYTAEQTAFAASCVFPIVLDGVQALTVGAEGPVAGTPSFANGSSDAVRVSSRQRADGRQTLRFDVLPRPGVSGNDSIKRIICVVDGKTPFRIEKLAYNTILLRLNGVDKGVICTAAHRENAYEMADTCACEKDPLPTHKELPDVYQLEEVYIPPDDAPGRPEGGIPDGADNAFYLVVANVLGYDNPLSITLEDGSVAPKTEELKVVVEGTTADLADGEMLDDMTSKGVVLQVPGLGGGKA